MRALFVYYEWGFLFRILYRMMKLKIPPVVVFFLAFAIMFGGYYLTPELSYSFRYQTILSRIFLASGVFVAFSGIIAFRLSGTTVDPRFPKKATNLVQSGIYKFTRNPMYLGMALVLIGGVIRIGNPVSFAGIIFFIWFLNSFQIKPEEEALLELFGDEYKEYCGKVRRWA
ncbi:MAG: isoprenylcysteine carboxylmethyltransferase family protein [Bacteroidota bacterium]